jgi:hypothetical protein
MPSPPDRPVNVLEVIDPAAPLPPLNFTCSPGFDKHTVDLWWSNPGEISANTLFNILGVNIYRSFDSEYGPYHRMNAVPVQAQFFRDKAQVQVVLQEDISSSFICRGPTDPSGRWVFVTQNKPLALQPAVNINTADLNVYVTIDGVPAHVSRINAQTGEVQLSTEDVFDVASQTTSQAVVPSENSVVLASYRYFDGVSKTSLYQRVFYRATTVAADDQGQLFETPLDKAITTNTNAIENLDWIWREATRRNKFILYQGGERVKAFIRKAVGPKCGCYSYSNKQPASDCLVCYGTSIIGGYDGPYDIMVAPDDAEKKIEQSNRGRSFMHSYETWTGPNPLLSQRDFIVKLNGDRYGIGPVRMPTNRGMQLQQHFLISHLDETDIRYKVPVLDTSTLIVPQTRYLIQGQGEATPMTTQRDAIPDERQIRGRTATFENNNRR